LYFLTFRGWRRRGRLCHHLAVEDSAVPDFRGDFGVFDVLWRVKKGFLGYILQNVIKKDYIALPF
jgi:hypothetical protein